MLWFSLLLLLLLFHPVLTDDAMEKFKSCQREECIWMQCYFPVPEFLNATRHELEVFGDFIESNHLFISYHLCNDLSADNIEEVGACIYGVLFKLYQYDANATIQQRVHVQQAQIQEESVAVVLDMISKLLYRVETINDPNELVKSVRKSKREEDVVVVNVQSLTPKAHLDISRTILNYGPWFTFVYFVPIDNHQSNCLYDIYLSQGDLGSTVCGMENNIRMKLEEQIGSESVRMESIKWASDLSHINAFPRMLSTLFYIHVSSTFTVISNARIIIIPVNIGNLKTTAVENQVLLRGPYPFYLFWLAKKNAFQRLGDQPSDELIDQLLDDEQEQDMTNMHGMFDDDVRHLADQLGEIEPDPHMLFLKTESDYHHIRRMHSKSAVLFTVRWDATSKLARRAWHRLASRLHPYFTMVDIDCFDWTELCDNEHIIEWPMLVFYDDTTERKIYQGSTDEQEMALALLRFAVQQPLQIEDDASETSLNSLLSQQPVTVLARIQQQDKVIYDTYKKLVDMFRDDERLFFMYQYSTESSCLIIQRKYGDEVSSFEPTTAVHPFTDDIMELRILIEDALRITLIPFNPVDFVKSPSSVLIAASRSQLNQLKTYLPSDDSLLQTPFVWIDTNSPWVVTINQYGSIVYPAVIYINWSHGHVYVNSTLTDVGSWLTAVRTGSIPPFYELSSSETSEGPSQMAIDFNRQVGAEQLLDEIRLIHEESDRINEHGLGFDTDGLPIHMNP